MMATDYFNSVAAGFTTVEASNDCGDPLPLNAAMGRAVDRLRHMHNRGGDVYLVGNGGSAAIVAHVQNDFVKAAKIRARLCQDIALLTACSNDLDYAKSMSSPLSIWLKPSDMLIAVSSSGESPNIINAIGVAQTHHATVLTFTGFNPANTIRGTGDLNFYVP